MEHAQQIPAAIHKVDVSADLLVLVLLLEELVASILMVNVMCEVMV